MSRALNAPAPRPAQPQMCCAEQCFNTQPQSPEKGSCCRLMLEARPADVPCSAGSPKPMATHL